VLLLLLLLRMRQLWLDGDAFFLSAGLLRRPTPS
jgi:hypothetical protein